MMRDHPNIARAMYTAQLVDEGIMRAWIVSMGRRPSDKQLAHLQGVVGRLANRLQSRI